MACSALTVAASSWLYLLLHDRVPVLGWAFVRLMWRCLERRRVSVLAYSRADHHLNAGLTVILFLIEHNPVTHSCLPTLLLFTSVG